MTLSALAFVAEHWCRAPCSCRSKSPARMQGAQQQTRRLPLLQSIDGRQTGGRTDDRYIDPAPHMRTVSIIYRVGQKSKMLCQYVNKTETIEQITTATEKMKYCLISCEISQHEEHGAAWIPWRILKLTHQGEAPHWGQSLISTIAVFCTVIL